MRALLLTLALTAASTAVAKAQTAPVPKPIEIVTQEQLLWTTMAEGDFATVRKLFTTDFIEVDSHIAALDTLLVTLQQCHLTQYELRDLQVRILEPNSALTAYHVVDTFDCGTAGKPDLHHFDNNDTTVWVRHSGKWLAQLHTETPAKSGPPPTLQPSSN
jgi:hypothetical protein